MNDRDGLQPAERLWTPWRMAYVGGGTSAPGCVFCTAHAGEDDARYLIVHRGERAFVIMNLYPYNTGHLMVVPYDHQDDLARLDTTARGEMAELTAAFCTGLRQALRCEGFNTGMNLGDVAGAGIADHLHQHVVPRWRGDANFMPIVGSTKVLPELIPATYAKIRADVARQKSGSTHIRLVAATDDGTKVVLEDGRLPRARLDPATTAWSSVTEHIEWAMSASLLGWAGPSSTLADWSVEPALTVAVTLDDGFHGRLAAVPIPEALASAFEPDRIFIRASLDRGWLAPAGRG